MPEPDSRHSEGGADQLAGRLRRLAAVTTDLLGATSIAGVTDVVTNHLTDAADAVLGSLSLLVDDDTLALVGIRGGREGVASRWATYPLAGRTPAADAVRAGTPLVLVGRAEIRGRYPDLEVASEGERSMVCLPLVVSGRPLGVVTLSFAGRREIDDAEMTFLGLLTDICAQTIDRINAQADAADREAKLAFLAEASERLARDLDYEATLTAVAEAAVPWFADWCVIALEDDGQLRTLAVAHAQPQHAGLVKELQERYPSSPDVPRGTYQVLFSGVSDLVPEISDDLLAQTAQDADHLRLLKMLDFRSAMACPLKVHDRVVGVITWVTGTQGRRFDTDDLAFGEDLAHRAAVAIDNAQLHTQLRDVALHLTHAVLPDSLPRLPDWELEVRYLPAGRTDAGGDFYDVVPLPDGRLAMFVGDVMGRGVHAASVMAQMRSAVRTLIALDPEPAAVMQGLDLVFERLGLEHLVTLVYAVADSGAGYIDTVNAGHPPPLIVRQAAVVPGEPGPTRVDMVVGAETMILGAGGGDRSVVRSLLNPGDTVLIYTDGLVERRHEDIDAGLARLVSACIETDSSDLDAVLEHLVVTLRDPTRDDDVAVLAARLTSATPPSGTNL
ncbi:SpoIIE family protein phosphatase [Nocardioides sp.]|uniref:GAF domain-containing SpoIIE family protein phosphatase n=1 Tax=Nocardioides sp. TaxID=35761 RepID=UPI0031FE8C1B|nr:putative regulatory protein [Nocardioides sp.]